MTGVEEEFSHVRFLFFSILFQGCVIVFAVVVVVVVVVSFFVLRKAFTARKSHHHIIIMWEFSFWLNQRVESTEVWLCAFRGWLACPHGRKESAGARRSSP